MTVHLVGAGPGDPGLLTVRGAELLRRAEVVVYDRLSVASLLDLAPTGADRINVGKDPAGASVPQERINELLEIVRREEFDHEAPAFGVCLDNDTRAERLGKRLLEVNDLARLAVIGADLLLRDRTRDALGRPDWEPLQNYLPEEGLALFGTAVKREQRTRVTLINLL